MEKVKVRVLLSWDENGIKHPSHIIYNDHTYPIDRVVTVRNCASLRTGGFGERYTIRILGKEYYLFFEDPYWWLLTPEKFS